MRKAASDGSSPHSTSVINDSFVGERADADASSTSRGNDGGGAMRNEVPLDSFCMRAVTQACWEDEAAPAVREAEKALLQVSAVNEVSAQNSALNEEASVLQHATEDLRSSPHRHLLRHLWNDLTAATNDDSTFDNSRSGSSYSGSCSDSAASDGGSSSVGSGGTEPPRRRRRSLPRRLALLDGFRLGALASPSSPPPPPWYSTAVETGWRLSHVFSETAAARQVAASQGKAAQAKARKLEARRERWRDKELRRLRPAVDMAAEALRRPLRVGDRVAVRDESDNGWRWGTVAETVRDRGGGDGGGGETFSSEFEPHIFYQKQSPPYNPSLSGSAPDIAASAGDGSGGGVQWSESPTSSRADISYHERGALVRIDGWNEAFEFDYVTRHVKDSNEGTQESREEKKRPVSPQRRQSRAKHPLVHRRGGR